MLAVSGLGHRFAGQPWLFRGLAFDHGPGEIVGLCGPSGSGKSTLLSIVAGWETPAEGSVLRPEDATIGWVFQNPHGVARRSALDHVVLPLLATGLRRAQAEPTALGHLRAFGLEGIARQPFCALSGGEAQRLMLARAVASAPSILLVDEPTAQLDTTTAQTVSATLGSIARSGSVVLVATHDLGIRAACTRVIDLAHFATDPPAGWCRI